MKKIIFFPILLSVLAVLSITANANNEINESDYFEAIESVIDSETTEKLEKIGIDSLTSEEMFSISFNKIGEYFGEDLVSKTDKAFSAFFRQLCIIILLIVTKVFMFDEQNKSIELIGGVFTALLSVDICSNLIEMLLSTLKTGGSFLISFVPVYTVILSLSGTASAAVTYNSVTFFFAQAISLIINSIATDFVGIFLSLSMAFSLNSVVNFNRFITTANKIVSTVLGFFASSFAAVLSVRGVLSASIDSAASKSIKFLIGSLIPIVGPSISDAYSTVLGSINVLKGSVAVAGIVIMLLISVPPVLEGIIYCLSFSLLSYITEMADLGTVSSVLRAFQSIIRTLILLNIFQLFILIVSTAVMISVKGGA